MKTLGELVEELTRLLADRGSDVRVRISAWASGDFEIKDRVVQIANCNSLWLIAGAPVDSRDDESEVSRALAQQSRR